MEDTYYIIKHKTTDEYYVGTINCQTEQDGVAPLFDSDINRAILSSNLEIAKFACEELLQNYNVLAEPIKIKRTTIPAV